MLQPPDDTPRVVGYRPDRGKVTTVYGLATALAAVALFGAAPAVVRMYDDGPLDAPRWAQVALLIAGLQLAYVAWMASTPDWSTVWVAMWVFALVASFYALIMGVAVFTPRSRVIILEMADERDRAAGWCAAVVLLTFLATYMCGRVAFRWQKTMKAALDRT
jgi:hypothetical protein